jgi:hypothetical protein
VKLPTRKSLLRLVILSLTATAMLGIAGVLWSGLGETGTKILGTAIAADAASFLALCCTGRVTSAWQRAVQVTGIVSACLGLLTGVYLIWWGASASGPRAAIWRAAAALFVLAVASAHASLLLRLRPHGRLARAVVTGTVICTAAAAELIANYALVPQFRPGKWLRQSARGNTDPGCAWHHFDPAPASFWATPGRCRAGGNPGAQPVGRPARSQAALRSVGVTVTPRCRDPAGLAHPMRAVARRPARRGR